VKGLQTERRSRPEGFHSVRKNKGHPKREARRLRANQRLRDQIEYGQSFVVGEAGDEVVAVLRQIAEGEAHG